MFYVTEWETGEIRHEFKKLEQAQKWARGAGHTGEDHPMLTGYPPICYVANENGEVVYNPRFSKRLGAAVGNLINAHPSDYM